MKNFIFTIFCLVIGSCCFTSCSDDIETTKQDYPSTSKYIKSTIGNSSWNADSSALGTFYAKVNDINTPSWIDIVISSDDINSSSTTLIHKYIFFHINNSTIAKNFSLQDSTIYPISTFSIMYYENKSVSSPISFDLYLRNYSGDIVITKCDGSFISGYFKGKLQNQVLTTDIRSTVIFFNRVPLSIAKKSILENNSIYNK